MTTVLERKKAQNKHAEKNQLPWIMYNNNNDDNNDNNNNVIHIDYTVSQSIAYCACTLHTTVSVSDSKVHMVGIFVTKPL